MTDPLTGMAGKYTVHVNNQRQPHGYEALVYVDRSAKTAIWKNAVADRCWTPGGPSSPSPLAKKNTFMPNFDPGDKTKQRSPSKMKQRPSPPAKTNTFLPNFELGDVGTPRHMLPAGACPTRAAAQLTALETHDFAFILRSDGRWTYAIIANREDDVILFVVDTVGDAKVVKRKNWATSIRLVDPKEARCPVTR